MSVEIFEPSVEPRHPERELVTFFIGAYNQERFIREAVQGAFAQSYQPLEIILSDDCSSDATFEIMRRMAAEYRGPHRLVLNRNEPNLGLCGHVNRLLELSSGEIVVAASGDDISLPERVEKSWRAFVEHPEISCVTFGHREIDAEGKPRSSKPAAQGTLELFTLADFIARGGLPLGGAARAYRKSVFGYFGPLSLKAATEDSTTLMRCVLLGSAAFSDQVAILYRVHGSNYYASDNRYSINQKRIYWQYLTDIRVALKRGLISAQVAKDLKTILRLRLRKNLLVTDFYWSKSKLKYFITKILFSGMVETQTKKHLLLQTVRSFRNARR